ncbi:MAG: sugar phosphate isomerase/epimerase, partial [Faecalibacterium sp.]|nr:sugar phosphate isomerase/epimerase [Faecalibacterium sp.]
MSKKGLIGVQMSTIAPAKMPKFDAYESMAKLVELGYYCAEVSQVPMTKENVAGFKRAIDELGFNISSLTAAVSPMVPGMPGEYLSNPDDYKKMLEDARTLNCDMFRIGMMPMNAIGNFEKCVDFAKQAEEYALKLKEDGIDLYYHNHHIEFMKVNGQDLLDIR